MDAKALEEARKAMIAKRFGGCPTGASTGGEGTARRKKKGSTKAGGPNIFYAINIHFQ
jgi:hypothetical protein